MEQTVIAYRSLTDDCWRRKYMKRLLLVVVLFFVLGSAMVSSMNSLSYTFKSIFYSIAMTVLIVIGLLSLYRYFRRTKH